MLKLALVCLAFATSQVLAAPGFSVGIYQQCPRNCANRIRYCMKTACTSCADCSNCGTFGVRTCPTLGPNYPPAERAKGKCKGNLDTLPSSSSGVPFETCGCLNSKRVPNSPVPTCDSGKPFNPPRSHPLYNPNNPVPGQFSVSRNGACPPSCSGSATTCTTKQTCRVCTDCSPCGSYAGVTCPAGVLPGDAKCRNNMAPVAATAAFPPSPAGSAPYTAATACGCPAGTTQSTFNKDSCVVAPPSYGKTR